MRRLNPVLPFDIALLIAPGCRRRSVDTGAEDQHLDADVAKWLDGAGESDPDMRSLQPEVQ